MARVLLVACFSSHTNAAEVPGKDSFFSNYSDMWWGGTAENGWGLSIQQHGNTQFNALYVYDQAGRPTWYVMPGGIWNIESNSYSGPVYQPRSAPLDRYSPDHFAVGASPGFASITFVGRDTALLQYVIDGVFGQHPIERQVFGSGQAPLQVGDMWWGGAAQDGWGISIVQQSGTLFVAWYTYGGDGKPSWYVLPGGAWSGTRYSGPFYSTTGSPWLGATYRTDQLAVNPMGTMALDFADANNATMSYVFTAGPFAGTSQSKVVVWQPY